MAVNLPHGFVDLWTASARTGSEVSIIGVVSDFLPARKSSGSDFTCTFSLADRTHGGIGDVGYEGLKVRFFKKLQSELPVIWGLGDVLILRNMRIKPFMGMTLALSANGSTWTVIRASSIPDKSPANAIQLPHTKGPKATVPSLSEMTYAIDLCNYFEKGSYKSKEAPFAASPSQTLNAIPSATQVPRQKFSLVKDLQIATFRDLVGQVVKCFPSNGRIDLYITDYTPNQQLYFYQWGQDEDELESREGDEFGYVSRSSRNTKKWPGPFGKLTLAVTLWPPHADQAQQIVEEGDFVCLRNVHIRLDKDMKMVASLHEDRKYPDKIEISVLTDFHDDDRVKDVLRRKLDYNKKFQGEAEKYVIEARETKDQSAGESKALSKNQKRKRKQEKEKAQLIQSKQANQANNKRKRDDNTENEPPASSSPENLSKRDNYTSATSTSPHKAPKLTRALNPNIHCAHHLTPTTPLSSILSLDKHTNTTPVGTTYTLPFQNINTRATVRVIDFYPSNLAKFAIPSRKRSEYAVLSDHEDSESESDIGSTQRPTSSTGSPRDREDQKWEWRFALLLEDASDPRAKGDRPTLKAYVVGADAECLLKLDAEDLRKSPTALAALREKLFILWGDLEERKTKIRETEPNVLSESSGNNRALVANLKREEKGGRPFQCCLKEYGVKVKTEAEEVRSGGCASDGDESEEGESGWRWERRWRVFGCTIT